MPDRDDERAHALSRRSLLGGFGAAAPLVAAAGAALGPASAQAPASGGQTSAGVSKPRRKLLLGAGGIKGAFQAGAIKRVLDAGFKPDVIYGVSAGSLNGAFLSDRAFFLGKPKRDYFAALGQPMPDGIDATEPVDWPFIGARLTAFWRDNVTGPSSLIRRRTVRSALALLFRRFDGIYDTQPLRDLIRATLDRERIRASGVPFGCVATNIDTGQPEHLFEGQDGMDIRDAVLASAAMPIAFPLVEIESTRGKLRYCDGAVRETVPVTLAAKTDVRLPATHLVAIVTQPPRSVLGRLEQPGNIVHVLQRQIDIVAEEIVVNDLEKLRRSGIRQVVIRPDLVINRDDKTKRVYEIDNFEAHHIREMIGRGGWYAGYVLDRPDTRFREDGFV
jgi:NTE family protein